jgi:hypothetical protein
VAGDVAENLILPVPVLMSAVYLVPVALSAQAGPWNASPAVLARA